MTTTISTTGKTDRANKIRKVALSIAAAAFAVALVGVGAFAEWSTSVSKSQTVTAGDVDLTAPGTNQLTVAATGVAPGDTIQRQLDLVNSGSLDLRSVTLGSSAGATPPTLFSDTTNGLQLTVISCDQAWTGASAPYTCGGTATAVYSGPASISPASEEAGDLAAATAGGTDFLLFQLTLPTTAPNTMQGQSVTIDYTFTGLSRTGTQK
jgi:spore coat-associated protein N